MEKPIKDVSLVEEANEWYCAKVQERKGKPNDLRSHDDDDKVLRERLDCKQEEGKEEEEDDNEEG